MIDAIVAGRMFATATQRTGANGKRYVTAKVTASASDGESLFVNAIAFADAPCEALLALDAGDSVALAGPMTAKAYTSKSGEPRPSLDMQVQQVLTAYHVTRKRKAFAPGSGDDGKQAESRTAPASTPGGGAFDDFGDDL